MKVQLNKIDPNPFRDIEHYPIQQSKVENLKRSINKTGYWDTIVGRVSPKNKGHIQIAFGHHRLTALKDIFKPSDEIEIIIKNFSDDDMLRVMLLENDEDYDSNPVAFNEGIKQLWGRLKSSSTLRLTTRNHRKFLAFEELPLPGDGDNIYSTIAAWQLANWITPDYSDIKVSRALEVLRETGQVEIDEKGTKKETVAKEAAEKMPSKTAAHRFVNITKKSGLSHRQQKRVAQKIADTGDFSERGIRAAIIDEKQANNHREKNGKELKLYELGEEIKETSLLISKVNSKVLTLIRFREEIADSVYKTEINKLGAAVMLLIKNLKTLVKGEDNGPMLLEG